MTESIIYDREYALKPIYIGVALLVLDEISYNVFSYIYA